MKNRLSKKANASWKYHSNVVPRIFNALNKNFVKANKQIKWLADNKTKCLSLATSHTINKKCAKRVTTKSNKYKKDHAKLLSRRITSMNKFWKAKQAQIKKNKGTLAGKTLAQWKTHVYTKRITLITNHYKLAMQVNNQNRRYMLLTCRVNTTKKTTNHASVALAKRNINKQWFRNQMRALNPRICVTNILNIRRKMTSSYKKQMTKIVEELKKISMPVKISSDASKDAEGKKLLEQKNSAIKSARSKYASDVKIAKNRS